MKRKSKIEDNVLPFDDEEKKKRFSLREFLRIHWIPILLTLIIVLLTIIIVPIIYTIQPNRRSITEGDPSWNQSGRTLLSQRYLLQGRNQSLGSLSALFIDRNDHLYLLEKSHHRLLRWNEMDGNSLTLIIGHFNGSEGKDSQSLNQPNDLYIDQSLRIFLVDTFNDRIQYFSDPKFVQSLPMNSIELNRPMSITMNEAEEILYIADYGNNQIIEFYLKNSTSNILIASKSSGNRNSYLKDPISIRFDSQSFSLLIAQKTSFNVVRWKLGSSYWTLVAGSTNSDLSGTSRTLFDELCSIQIDRDGLIYVVDCHNERIQFFKKDLEKGKTILGVTRAKGNNSYLFSRPTALTFDSKRNLYVADSGNFRIQRFQFLQVDSSL